LTLPRGRLETPLVPRVEVRRTYLELGAPEALKAAPCPTPEARIEQVHGCPPSFFRYLYAEVGRRYHWTDRLGWSDEEMAARLADPAVSLHLLSVSGAPAGYFELEREPDGSVQVAFFGLLPEFHGRGLGKYLLTRAAEEAFALGASRVWLHTCTLDDPAALPNYRARGFVRTREETYEAEVPERGVTPWSSPCPRS
jgi:ribosomal protein S18 acetylase RimI-like enzyme